MVSKKLVVLTLIIVALSYHLYVPIHPGISKPWGLRSFFAVFKVLQDIAHIGSFLHIDTYHNIYVGLANKMMDRSLDPSTFQGVEVKEHYFNKVRTLVFTPPSYKGKGGGAAYVDYHGGGWVLGKPETFSDVLINMAKELNIVVVSVDYRLAPQFRYPIPFQDCVQATVGFLESAQDFGVDPERVAIGGGSAGGNLAAAVALKLSNDEQYAKLPKIKMAALLFPALQIFDFSLPSYQSNKDDPLLPRDMMISYWLLYVHGNVNYLQQAKANNHTDKATYKALGPRIDWALLPAGHRESYEKVVGAGDKEAQNAFKNLLIDPFVSPLLASDSLLQNLPNIYLVTCDYDVLRDDGLMFKQRLLNLSVPVTHHHYQFYHGVTGVTGTTEAFKSLRNFFDFWRSQTSLL